MQRLFKLHWNALAIVIYMLLSHSLPLAQHLCIGAGSCTHTLTHIETNTRTTHHERTHAQMVPIRNACMCMCVYGVSVCVCACVHIYVMHVTATPSHVAPHPHTHTHTNVYGPAFEFGFVSVRSRRRRRRLRLAGLFARFGYPHPAAIMSRQHHHRFISFTRT